MDKIIELLGKILGLLGKLIEALFSSKVFWLIVIAVAIFSVAAFIMKLALPLADVNWLKVWQALAIASIALILAKVIIWVIGLLLKQFA